MKTKHDCMEWIDEGRGCSVCSRNNLDKEKAKELINYTNWTIGVHRELLEFAVKVVDNLVRTVVENNDKEPLEVLTDATKLKRQVNQLIKFCDKRTTKGE